MQTRKRFEGVSNFVVFFLATVAGFAIFIAIILAAMIVV